jgi:hypothetical protein
MEKSKLHNPVSLRGTAGLALFLVIVNLVALTALFVAWPGMEDLITKMPPLPDEIRYLVISLVGGLFGTSVLLLVSFATFVAEQRLKKKMISLYILQDDPSGFFTGQIDDVRIFNQTLTVEEI